MRRKRIRDHITQRSSSRRTHVRLDSGRAKRKLLKGFVAVAILAVAAAVGWGVVIRFRQKPMTTKFIVYSIPGMSRDLAAKEPSL